MRGRRAALLLATAVGVAACGGGHHRATATTLPATTTSAAPTTTTAPASAPTYPLTGLAVTDPARARLPALIVKIDNSPRARPQAGLAEADIVVEEQVEGGVTRFAAIFQSTDGGQIGPIRSARSTDIALVADLNHPLFAYSGANARFLQLVHAAPLVDVGVDAVPPAYSRDPKRPSPYNLFSATAPLFARARPPAGPPPPLFSYRPNGQPPAGAGVVVAAHLTLHFPGAFAPVITYDWDAAHGVWLRAQDGQPHVDTAGHRIAPRNVVIQFITYTPTGLVDQAHTPVYQGNLVGSGPVWVFTGGMLIRGRWSRANASSVTAYTDSAGAPILLAPGQTWVELPAIGTPVQTG